MPKSSTTAAIGDRTSGAPFVEEVPKNTEPEQARVLAIQQSTSNAYSPALAKAFDGNENTYIQWYTYASGGASTSWDNPISVQAIEVLAGPTTGYSGERGWFGGPVTIKLDDQTLIDLTVPTSPISASRWRKQVNATGKKLTVVKHGSSRFRLYEIKLYQGV